MSTDFRPMLLRCATAMCAVLFLLFGFVVTTGGIRGMRLWGNVSLAYAAIAALWAVIGPVMLAAAAGILAWRDRRAIWAGAACAAVAGGTLIGGVLTYVIPCAGPS